MEKRFRSKIDLWILVVLVLGLVAQSYAMVAVISSNSPLSAKYTMAATTVLLFLLIGSILIGTVYTVTDRELRIRCGPIRKSIRREEIHRIYETRSPLSSPALSLDRLRIEYGRGRSVMISPADKKEFLAAMDSEIAAR